MLNNASREVSPPSALTPVSYDCKVDRSDSHPADHLLLCVKVIVGDSRSGCARPKPPEPSALLSLAEAAASIIFVVTKYGFCRDKSMRVATKDLFCRDKHVFVATKMILAAAPAEDSLHHAEQE